MLLLPPHTTDKLQPLDVGIFGPFSRQWIDRCGDIVILISSEMRKEDFIKEYMGVHDETFRSSVIISAFKKSGIWPINRQYPAKTRCIRQILTAKNSAQTPVSATPPRTRTSFHLPMTRSSHLKEDRELAPSNSTMDLAWIRDKHGSVFKACRVVSQRTG